MSSPTTRANERRQLNTMRRRAQRQLMTEEQRQAHLAQRRSNYQIRMNRRASSTYFDESNLNMLHATAYLNGEQNNSQQGARHRISERYRHSLAYDAWTTYLARRREAYRRMTETSTSPFNLDTSVLITNNLELPATPRAIMETSSNQRGIVATTMRQVCRIQTLPYQTMTSTFEQGSTSTCQRKSDLNHQGQHLNLLMQFNADKENDIQVVQLDDIQKYQQNQLWMNARLHMPVRTQIIGLGWKITIGMKPYDFGRMILRIFQKLKRHTAKRIGWIEGWDLTEKDIAARRQIEEKTLFRTKIRQANNVDIITFYKCRADQTRANMI